MNVLAGSDTRLPTLTLADALVLDLSLIDGSSNPVSDAVVKLSDDGTAVAVAISDHPRF